MKVLVSDPFYKGSDFENVSFDRLLLESNVISIHAPLLEGTRNAFNQAAFAKMKAGSFIVNCARGGIIHEQDLLVALQEGKLGGAALDVFEVEPFDLKQDHINELLKHPNFICTPHIGASTKQAQKAVGMECAHKVIAVDQALHKHQPFPQALVKPTTPRWKTT
jgi:D-3-phosphoglycerate dehydrogenase